MNKFRNAVVLRISFILCGIFIFMHNTFAQKQANYAAPGDYGIGGITVSGTQYLDQDILISLSGLRVGDKVSIPGDAISNAIKNLWDQGFFTDVKVYITKTKQLKRLYLNEYHFMQTKGNANKGVLIPIFLVLPVSKRPRFTSVSSKKSNPSCKKKYLYGAKQNFYVEK